MRCNRLMTLMRRKRRQYLAQSGDQIFGPLFPRRCNNAGRNPDNRVALFRFPCADAASRAVLAEKFLRQFFPAALALPKTEHGGAFQAHPQLGRKPFARVRRVSPPSEVASYLGIVGGFRPALRAIGAS
jgi:hypothetical protein